MPPHVPLIDRFFKYIQETGGCWNWMSGRIPTGYGYLTLRGKNVYAHRLSWTIFFGPIPEGLCVLHRCDNPSCVRPDHLFLGTLSDNSIDMWRKGRHPIPVGRQSSSGVRGVIWDKSLQRWTVRISRGRKLRPLYLGVYKTFEGAKMVAEGYSR